MAYKLKDRKEKMLSKAVFTNSPCTGTERVSANAFAVQYRLSGARANRLNTIKPEIGKRE